MVQAITKRKVLEETKARLERKIAALDEEIRVDPTYEAIKCHTTRFAAILDKYKGKERLSIECQKEVEALHEESKMWERKADKRKRSNRDFIKEKVQAQFELGDINNEIYFLNRREGMA